MWSDADPELIGALTSAAAATVGRERVGILLGFEAAWQGSRAAGPSYTVRGAAGDNLALHQVLLSVPPNCVLVADVGASRQYGHWGDLLTIAAQAAGAVGLVINGAIRDRRAIEAARFPVFHRGTSPRQAAKAVSGEVGVPVEIDGVTINSGDLVIADGDGIVAVPTAAIGDVLSAARELETWETTIADRLKRGETTVDVLGLPPR